jgi:phenylacetate-CoA ligase
MTESLLSGIRGNLAGMAWPALLTGPLASLVALAGELEESQWLPPAEIEHGQYRQLVALATHAAAESPHFARRMATGGLTPADLGSLEGLRRLPILKRREIQQSGAAFYCRNIPEAHGPIRETRTSGSTGEPVVIRRSAVSQLFWRAISLRFHAWSNRNLAGRCTSIRANLPEVMVQPDWGPPISRLFETGPLQSIPSNTDTPELARIIAAFNPDSLVIMPNTLEALRRHCARHAVTIPGLRLILTMSETLTPPIRAAAESYFQARVFDCYSSGELGIAALECPQSGLYHLMAETILMEMLDEEGNPCRPGETGRLVLTDLSNFASPLIRYDTGDYAELGDACSCGRGLPVLSRIRGRVRNLLRRPDGQRYWPRLEVDFYRELAPVIEHQIVQREIDLLEMRLVVERPLTEKQEADLADLLRHAVSYPFRVAFTYFEGEIPRGPGGKFEEFLCLLRDDADGEAGKG